MTSDWMWMSQNLNTLRMKMKDWILKEDFNNWFLFYLFDIILLYHQAFNLSFSYKRIHWCIAIASRWITHRSRNKYIHFIYCLIFLSELQLTNHCVYVFVVCQSDKDCNNTLHLIYAYLTMRRMIIYTHKHLIEGRQFKRRIYIPLFLV